jgi:hypothetical protein
VLTQPALSVTVTLYTPAGKFETVFDATFMVEPTMVPEAFVQTKSQGLAPEVGVAVIEPVLGRVIALIDAGNLVTAGKGSGEVLNGIAHNPQSGKIYMTGKYWPKMFEVGILK